jgi:hypothetical protein
MIISLFGISSPDEISQKLPGGNPALLITLKEYEGNLTVKSHNLSEHQSQLLSRHLFPFCELEQSDNQILRQN